MHSLSWEPKQLIEGVRDGVELIAGHPLRWRLGETEPGLGRLLDRGGLADPASDERRVEIAARSAAVVEAAMVGVADHLARPQAALKPQVNQQ
jgi:hypothetical protein